MTRKLIVNERMVGKLLKKASSTAAGGIENMFALIARLKTKLG